MNIITLEKKHEEAVRKLILQNYEEERSATPALPTVTEVPVLLDHGIAAVEDEQVLGFISYLDPWEHAFGTEAKGTFIPVHGHGCVKENRNRIYQRLYQVMADTLVKNNVLYHAISLYAHDTDAICAFFHNGFGHRCSDGIREMNPIPVITNNKILYREIEDASYIRNLRRALSVHMGQSSCFMRTRANEFDRWIIEREQNGSRIFIAEHHQKPIAFLEISEESEAFITALPCMKNIHGAYCDPAYRGQQVMQSLMNYVIQTLQQEGYTHLGVDWESFNPTAQNFWPKYFEPYTYSVTRRIDENS